MISINRLESAPGIQQEGRLRNDCKFRPRLRKTWGADRGGANKALSEIPKHWAEMLVVHSLPCDGSHPKILFANDCHQIQRAGGRPEMIIRLTELDDVCQISRNPILKRHAQSFQNLDGFHGSMCTNCWRFAKCSLHRLRSQAYSVEGSELLNVGFGGCPKHNAKLSTRCLMDVFGQSALHLDLQLRLLRLAGPRISAPPRQVLIGNTPYCHTSSASYTLEKMTTTYENGSLVPIWASVGPLDDLSVLR